MGKLIYTKNDMEKLAATKNLLFISDQFIGVNKIHRWKCCLCNHEWETTPQDIQKRNVYICPNCSPRRWTVDRIKEFAAKIQLEFLSNSCSGVRSKYLWRCPNGHQFYMSLGQMVDVKRCSQCNKWTTEEVCRFIIQSLTKSLFSKTRTILGHELELDGYNKELNIAFEYQGEQHFRYVRYFHKSQENFLDRQKRDQLKVDLCKQQDIYLIEIPYWEKKPIGNLISFIKNKLPAHVVIGDIDWSEFSVSSELKEIQTLALSKNIECLSTVFFNSSEKMLFRCLTCGCEWEATSNKLKLGTGCPKCSYDKMWETRKEKYGKSGCLVPKRSKLSEEEKEARKKEYAKRTKEKLNNDPERKERNAKKRRAADKQRYKAIQNNPELKKQRNEARRRQYANRMSKKTKEEKDKINTIRREKRAKSEEAG